MKIVVLLLVALVPIGIQTAADPALMFDMGTKSSPVGSGYVAVFADTAYTPRLGYGWDHPADRGFYSEWDVPERYREWHPNHAGPMGDAVLTDGVTCDESIAFLVDVSPGRYSVMVTVGGYEAPRHDMSVRINGKLIAQNIDAWGRIWGSQGGSPTKTVKGIVTAEKGRIRIDFGYTPSTAESWQEYTGKRPEDGRLWYLGTNTNSIVAVRIRPWQRLPVWAEEGELRTSLKDNPHFLRAVAAYNAGDPEGAYEAAERISGEDCLLAKACLYEWLAGDMSLHDRDREQELLQKSISILEKVASTTASPLVEERLEMDRRYLLATRYLKMFAYSWAEKLTGINSYHRYWAAYDLCGAFTPDDPLYFKSHLVRGKVAYWNGREGGWKHCYALAKEHFGILKEAFPGDRYVRMYSGERVPSRKKYAIEAPGAPEWAVKQREALARISDLIRYWVEKRQSENGELGGGWGDDVEILRSWGASVLAVDDPVARDGAEKIANGVWASGQIESGYSKGVGDVEHASEPVSDTQPLMVATRYGEPQYVERCMETMRCMRDVWTGRSQLGHLHFKSHYYSATKVDTNPPRSADVALNARAVKPGVWVVWYNGHPVVKSLLEDWSKAWVEDAMRTDRGKPAGIVPGSVSFPEDRIGGYADAWWKTRGYFSDLTAAGYTASLYNIMVSAYGFSGSELYVTPIVSAMDAASRQWKSPVSGPTTGSLPWVGQLHMNRKFSDVVEKWRLLSGEPKYDDYLKARGSSYLRYLLSGEIQPMVSQLQGIIDSLSCNIEMSTSEVLFTDRVGMPGAELIFSMMTGGVGDATYFPLHAVTWEDAGDHLAALVQKSQPRRLSLLAYNFSAKEHTFGMRLWRLEPGEYELVVRGVPGGLKPEKESPGGDRVMLCNKRVGLPERGTRLDLPLPPRILCEVELVQRKASPRKAGALADLAVGPGDLTFEPRDTRAGQAVKVTVTVHNLGTAPASGVKVFFLDGDSVLAEATIDILEAPLDLVARTAKVTGDWSPKTGRHRMTAVVDPGDSVAELVELNNRCYREIDVR